ncbi:TPA: ATP-binding protein [Clostridium perfringens]|nr:ATP-binding protein [Clostridium perfringens]
MLSEKCMFSNTCKNKDTDLCNPLCYPFIVLHGQKGETGFWKASGVPNKYKKVMFHNLPIKAENPKAYDVAERYINKIESVVEEKGIGLFLYSIPNTENTFGTGTGKTTTAVAILNEYVLNATRRHLKGQKELKKNPALFIKASELQNKYNAQFRGTFEMQQEASNCFYRLKERMKGVSLLVIDDIAVRDITEAFKNELFEILDYRATESKATIFTSNYPITKLVEFLGERIVSRIDGMTIQVGFQGKDHRKGGIF